MLNESISLRNELLRNWLRHEEDLRPLMHVNVIGYSYPYYAWPERPEDFEAINARTKAWQEMAVATNH